MKVTKNCCGYSDRYKAIVFPKCGCRLCASKWVQHHIMERSDAPPKYGHFSQHQIDNGLIPCSLTATEEYIVWLIQQIQNEFEVDEQQLMFILMQSFRGHENPHKIKQAISLCL